MDATDDQPAPEPPPQGVSPAPAADREDHGPFKAVVSILIAAVAVIGALVTWRATVVASASGAENVAGLAATLNVEQTRTVTVTQLYQHYAAYTTFARYREQGRLLDTDFNRLQVLGYAPDVPPRLGMVQADLDRRRVEAYDMANAGQYFFPTRYLDQDGQYNIQREAGEASAEAARQLDLYPDQHFARADQLRDQSNNLVAVVIILTVSLLLYTFAAAEALHKRLRFAAAGAGLLVMVVGIVAALMVGL